MEQEAQPPRGNRAESVRIHVAARQRRQHALESFGPGASRGWCVHGIVSEEMDGECRTVICVIQRSFYVPGPLARPEQRSAGPNFFRTVAGRDPLSDREPTP